MSANQKVMSSTSAFFVNLWKQWWVPNDKWWVQDSLRWVASYLRSKEVKLIK